MELGLVVPVLLLLFAAAADLGRAFYTYVAVENAAKEGALYGSRFPLCDDASAAGCGSPNNVQWRVQHELNGLKDPGGTTPVPTIACLIGSSATARANIKDCVEGDTYQVSVATTFRLITPLLGQVLGNQIGIGSTSRAVVLNAAFDPSPGLSLQKYIDPSTAINGALMISNCTEPDDHDANGFYRSPCLDSTTPDPVDKITARYDAGTTVNYKVVAINSGAQTLAGLSFNDCAGFVGSACSNSWPAVSGNCPARPSSMPVAPAAGSTYVCRYSRVAPAVSGAGATKDYANTVTVTGSNLNATQSATSLTLEKPASLSVVKMVSTYPLGSDGDGVPTFGDPSLALGYTATSPIPYVWYYVGVTNTGAKTATGVSITDSLISLPFGQHNATADCDLQPSSLNAGSAFVCRYRVNLTKAATTRTNTAGATATNVVPDADDTDQVVVTVASCGNQIVPTMIGLTKAQATTAWSTAGFTGAITSWGSGTDSVVTQNQQAFTCLKANTKLTITNTLTPLTP